MRTQEQWSKICVKAIGTLPKRIQRDLGKLNLLEEIPEYGSYYLHGESGCGKTILAARMWLQAKKHFYFDKVPGTPKFVSVPELLAEIRRTFNNPDLDEAAVLAKYSETEFLVLDDLGAEKSSEWVMSVLYLLINRRYEDMRTTVITSNFNLIELDDKLGDARIPHRIGRMCTLLEPNWK